MKILRTTKNNTKYHQLLVIINLILVAFSVPVLTKAAGGSIYLAPSRGSFLIGSTFNVSIFVDTKGNEINVIQVDLKFPPDILQITTPTAGESFIREWLTPPTYSNVGGFVNFKGGIPEGIITSAGLVSTVTFRVKSSGFAKIEFLDSSKILLADGRGTPIATTNLGGRYELLVPPPEGPEIISVTHPDSDVWYQDKNPAFSWEKKTGVTDFSYSFSHNPREIPDALSEGVGTSDSYSNIFDGIWYFHVRAKENGIWGRASHFGVRIDTNSPEEFEARVDSSTGFVFFNTKDVHSRIAHYEISVLNVSKSPSPAPFFIESTSPYKIPEMESGKYSIIVRAYDKAGNWQEAKTSFRMISPFISFIEGKGIQIEGILFPWWLVYLIVFTLLFWIAFFIYYFVRRRPKIEKGIKEIDEALKEIKKIEEEEKETEKLKKKFIEKKEELEKRLSEDTNDQKS